MMTGEIVTDYHTGSIRYAHQLAKEGAVDLARMNSGRAPVIDNHNAYRPAGASVLGTVEQGSVGMTPEGLVGTIQFMPDDKLPETILNGLESDVLQNLSISATVLGMERVESDGLVLARITEWEPYEVSVVPVGADSGARMMKIAQSLHGPSDGDPAVPAAHSPQASPPAPDADAIRKEERERVAGIHSICQTIGADPESFIDAGQTVDEVRLALPWPSPAEDHSRRRSACQRTGHPQGRARAQRGHPRDLPVSHGGRCGPRVVHRRWEVGRPGSGRAVEPGRQQRRRR